LYGAQTGTAYNSSSSKCGIPVREFNITISWKDKRLQGSGSGLEVNFYKH